MKKKDRKRGWSLKHSIRTGCQRLKNAYMKSLILSAKKVGGSMWMVCTSRNRMQPMPLVTCIDRSRSVLTMLGGILTQMGSLNRTI